MHQTALRNLSAAGDAQALDVWLRHLKIFADLLGEIVVDFVVARDAGGSLGGAIHVNRVVATLTQQLAAMFLECRIRSRRFKP